MKKRVVIFLSAGIVILAFILRGRIGESLSAEDDFQVQDTAQVNRIEILSRDTIILTRRGDGWVLNEKVPASSIAVNNFLFSFQRMAVKGVNSKPDIAEETGIRVRIFEGKKRHFLRFYEIDAVSYLHKEGAGKLYAIEVSGFPAINPAEVISTSQDHWADRTLVNLKSSEISEVSVVHPGDQSKSFTIRQTGGIPRLYYSDSQAEVPENVVDTEKLNFYLSYFTNVFYDYTVDSDSISGYDIRWIIQLADTTGKKYELKVSPLKTAEGDDMFRAMVKYNDQPGYKVTRFMVLDLLLQDRDHFLQKSKVKSQRSKVKVE